MHSFLQHFGTHSFELILESWNTSRLCLEFCFFAQLYRRDIKTLTLKNLKIEWRLIKTINNNNNKNNNKSKDMNFF